jgi:plasmid stability protein
MAGQAITLHVPDDLYQRVKQEADRTHRSVEEELLEVVASAVPDPSALPDDLAAAVDQLTFLNDAALVRAAQSRLSRRAARRLESLHFKRQRDGLDAGEPQELEGLVRQYERTMLIRAHAALLLKQH